MNIADHGTQFHLPIRDYIISEITLSRYSLPKFLFTQDTQPNATLNLEAVVLALARGSSEHVLHWNQKTPYLPTDLTPLVELIGCTVKEAVAYRTGVLCLELSQGFSLRLAPNVWEGWHFSCDGYTCHGDDGRLI